MKDKFFVKINCKGKYNNDNGHETLEYQVTKIDSSNKMSPDLMIGILESVVVDACVGNEINFLGIIKRIWKIYKKSKRNYDEHNKID